MTGLDGFVLRRSTTAQQVADGLSERILAGAFTPGNRLRESAIASELGIARNTVREAVRILELGGLVRYEVNRGAVVISPTAENVDALYTARERLETAAVSRVPSSEQLTAIVEAFDALAQAADSRDARLIVDKDLALHCAIVRLLNSSRLEEFYAELTRELRFYLMVLSVEDSEFENPQAVLAEHEAIVSAIRSGDRDHAVREVRDHIETNAKRLKEILAQTGDTPARRSSVPRNARAGVS
jgi:DNA-binding GntR family transcriptional regulator